MTNLLKAAKDLIDNNAGPISTMDENGDCIKDSYVMVRREDFDALCDVVGDRIEDSKHNAL